MDIIRLSIMSTRSETMRRRASAVQHIKHSSVSYKLRLNGHEWYSYINAQRFSSFYL